MASISPGNRIVNGWYSETHTHWATQGLQVYLMGRLFWEPTADMQELKRWEIEKEIEELNARIARENQEG